MGTVGIVGALVTVWNGDNCGNCGGAIGDKGGKDGIGGNGTNRGKGAYGGKCLNSESVVKVWTVRTVGKVTGNCWNCRNSGIG